MKFTAKQIRNWSEDAGYPDRTWRPARPLSCDLNDGFFMRLRWAWGVIIKRYDVLDWQDSQLIDDHLIITKEKQ